MSKSNNESDKFIFAKNLSFYVSNKIQLLYDINMVASYNKVHGLIGPNGAGKTTLIKILIGGYKKSKGKLSIAGCNENQYEWKVKLGYIPENCKYIPIKKVKKCLFQTGYILGLSKKEITKRIDEFSDKYLDIRKFLNSKINSLSSGQQKLVMIVDAFLNDPDYLIFDEPTENLDPTHRIIFFKIIKDFLNSNKKRGVFISSHVLTELEKVCEEISFIRDGKCVFSGPVKKKTNEMEKLYKKYIILGK